MMVTLSIPIASAARAKEIARGFGAGAGDDASLDGRWLAVIVMTIAGCVAVGIVVARARRWWAARAESGPAVTRDVCRRLRLTRQQQRQLRAMARRMEVRHPVTLLLCPSLLRAARKDLPTTQRREVDLILLRLAA